MPPAWIAPLLYRLLKKSYPTMHRQKTKLTGERERRDGIEVAKIMIEGN
jgi:hypothetical protein